MRSLFSQSTTQEFQETMKAKQCVRSFVLKTLKEEYGKRIPSDRLKVVAEYVAMYRGEAKQKDGISGTPVVESRYKTLSRIRNMMERLIENAKLLKEEDHMKCLEEVQTLLGPEPYTEPLEAIVVC